MDTKTKRRTPPRESAYHRLTDEKRTIIETLRKEGRSLSSIEARFTGLTRLSTFDPKSDFFHVVD